MVSSKLVFSFSFLISLSLGQQIDWNSQIKNAPIKGKRTSGNTVGWNSIIRNSAIPEYVQQSVLPPPYTQVVNSAFQSGSTLPLGATSWQENGILATCENYSGTWNISGPPPQAACVGLMAIAIAYNSNSPVWAANLIAGDTPGHNSPVTGLELDVGTYTDGTMSQPSKVGIQISQVATNKMDFAIVVNSLQSPSPAGFQRVFEIGNSAISTGGAAIWVESQLNAVNDGLVLRGDYGDAAIRLPNNNRLTWTCNGGGCVDATMYQDSSNGLNIRAGGNLTLLSPTSKAGLTLDLNAVMYPAVYHRSQLAGVLTFEGGLVFCDDCLKDSGCSAGSGAFAKRSGGATYCN